MTPGVRRPAAWWAVACAVLAGVLVIMTGAPASAHASLLKTDPADGAVVATLPDQVVLTFNEPIRLDTDAVQGFGPGGADWPVTAQAQDNRVVVTPGADPGTGTVVLAWKVISADGHVVGGSLSFSIGAPSANAATPDATPTPTTAVQVARWPAAVVALGGLLAAIACVVGGRPRWFESAWITGFAAAVVLAPLQELAQDGRGLGGLTDWLAWLDGVVEPSSLLLLAAFLAVGLIRTARRGVLRSALLVVPALALVVGAAVTWPRLPEQPAEAASAPAANARADLGTSGSVTVDVSGSSGGPVTLDLRLEDPDGQPLRPFAAPSVVVGNDDVSLGEAQVEKTGPGHYRATVTIPRSGDWTADVSVRVDEFDNPVAEVSFGVR